MHFPCWQLEKLVYVSESTSLRHRMGNSVGLLWTTPNEHSTPACVTETVESDIIENVENEFELYLIYNNLALSVDVIHI